jgi:hypothetical protein
MPQGLYRIWGNPNQVLVQYDGHDATESEAFYRRQQFAPEIDDLPWAEEYNDKKAKRASIDRIGTSAGHLLSRAERSAFEVRARQDERLVIEIARRKVARDRASKNEDELIKKDSLEEAADLIVRTMSGSEIPELLYHLDAAKLGKLSAAVRHARGH